MPSQFKYVLCQTIPKLQDASGSAIPCPTAQPSSLSASSPPDRQHWLQNISRISQGAWGKTRCPSPPPGNPALSSRKHESRNCSSCAVLVAPRNVLRTGVMLQINVLEKKRGRPSAPDEHAASTTGQIFPASAYCPAPRRNRH